ncbi:transcription termination/antitermination protein NusG [bacterium]|nr:transcription termination/antitermination protein NusG [bacterium]
MGKWYILQVKTGHEDKIKKLLENSDDSILKKIEQVVVPKEDIIEVVKGEKKVKSRKFWPGYILMEIDDSADDMIWHKIKTTQGVIKFLGAGNPVPLSDIEAEKIMFEIEEKKGKATPKVEFDIGDRVEIKEGPFVNFSGMVEEVNPDKERLIVSISIFGRATPVELNYWQVEKT